MSKIYYHFTMAKLAAGSLIEPGNWGRLLKRYQHRGMQGAPLFGNPWILAKELVLEIARYEVNPSAPSRLSACFALPDIDAANRYQSTNDPNYLQYLHIVEIVQPELAMHVGYLETCSFPDHSVFLDPMRLAAQNYWRGLGNGDYEIVTASALRVVGHGDS